MKKILLIGLFALSVSLAACGNSGSTAQDVGKTIKTALGKVPVVQLAPDIFGDDKLIGGKGSLTVWLTDDARHIPVKGEISNEKGKLSLTLKSAKL